MAKKWPKIAQKCTWQEVLIFAKNKYLFLPKISTYFYKNKYLFLQK